MRPTLDLKNERELVERCQQGDLQAFEALYRQFEKPLLGTAQRMLGNWQDAEDAVQLAFLKLYRNIGKFRFKSKLSTYLFRILFNLCFDEMKKKKIPIKSTPHQPQKAVNERPDLRLHLKKAIAALPEKMRACFVLFAIQDLKQEDISQILGMKRGTVKAHIFAAKSRLRASFFEPLPGENK